MNNLSVTIILPTYQEFDSLPFLVEAVEKVKNETLQDLQLIIVDDNSDDGTEKLIREMQKDWIKLIIRREDRGLSPAVIAGIHAATSEFCVVMDADGSHPASAIPAMVKVIQDGSDFAVGSRYIKGGTTEDGWGVLRWLNSKIATIMARPFTKVLDPMSGFLAFRKSTFEQADDLNPVGYKIGLELIVKCNCTNVTEVPIHFSTRQKGESKLTLSVQWQYLQHVVRLLRYTKPNLVSFFTFATVGLSGAGLYVFLNMLTSELFTSKPISIAIAAWLTMSWNFIWDRKYAFWNSHNKSIAMQYCGFVLICSIPVLTNYFVTLYMSEENAIQLAALTGAAVGSAIGIVFNFMMTRLFVFR